MNETFRASLVCFVATVSGIVGCSVSDTAPLDEPSRTVEDPLLVTVTSTFQGGTSSYTGATDSQIVQSAPTTNYGTATSLNFDGDTGGGNDAYALFRWDLSAIPPSATIQSASITLRVTNKGAIAYPLYALKRSWSESSVTWSRASTGVAWQTPGALGANDRETTSLASIAATSIGTLTFPLNAAGLAKVRSWVNGSSPNYGVIIASPSLTDGADVDSRETATVANRPKLTVTYQIDDVDECALGTHNCVAPVDGGTCTNTPGSFQCGCDEDNTGNGVLASAGGTGCTEKATNPRLVVPRRMANDKTLTLRADVLDGGGKIDAAGCFSDLGTVSMTRITDGANIPLTVTVFNNHLPVPAGSIRFYHGVGSVSFTLAGGAAVPAGDYRVTVSIGGKTASRIVRVQSAPTWRVMPSTLSGADLTWGPNENIRISQHDTFVPAGQTLRILPGTNVMVDTTGSLENGTLITVNGTIDASGTRERPIHFFSARGPAAMTHALTSSLSNPDAWRGISFHGTGTSTMKFVVLTGAGNGVISSHPRPPIVSFFDTTNGEIEDMVLVDATGMGFQTPGTGTYNIRRSLISRVGIGGEFLGSGHTLRVDDTWWTGIGHGPTSPQRFDGDAVHVDGGASNQMIRRNIIADVGDDCVDHSNSAFTVEDSIIHDCVDKAISLTSGGVTVRNSLLFNAGTGIRGRGSVYNSTIAAPSPIETVNTLQESIIWPQSVSTCGGAVNYSIVGSATDLGCGTGNLSVDPRFSNTAACNYNPQAGSPALTAGPGGTRIGWKSFPSW